jgi:nicotinate phosphoribosyltransferase
MMDPLKSPLLTDLYQLTMLNGYVHSGMKQKAVFEFFVRALPESRSFLVACGLESCLSFLEDLYFSEEEIDYLKRTQRFSNDLLEGLKTLRFTGDVYALPEGTVFFADEPIVRIEAPISEAQLVETRLINLLQYQTLVATKAARCVLAANGRAALTDFGVRRAHGAEAGLLAARASYIAGFIGTSTVLAEPLYGIPIFGTMAHSFIEAHKTEEDAFVDFCLANPNNTTLLIDTYDTMEGAKKAVYVARQMAQKGIRIQRVRLDSGDIMELSKAVRRLFNQEGFPNIQIFVSGGIDEFSVQKLLDGGAPINGFGIGTKLDTSDDAPYLECAYKLTEYAGIPRMKKSSGKVSYPGKKQVFRLYDHGRKTGDIMTVDGDALDGIPIIEMVMKEGKRLSPAKTLSEISAHTRGQLEALPSELRNLTARPSAYPVKISPALEKLKDDTESMLRERG